MKIKINYIPECSPILEEWVDGNGKIHWFVGFRRQV